MKGSPRYNTSTQRVAKEVTILKMNNFIVDMLLSLPVDQSLERIENAELDIYVLNVAEQCIVELLGESDELFAISTLINKTMLGSIHSDVSLNVSKHICEKTAIFI